MTVDKPITSWIKIQFLQLLVYACYIYISGLNSRYRAAFGNYTKDLLLLATGKDINCSTNVTQLVVVWSLCSVCTSVTKVILSINFAIAIARSRKISVPAV